ncbi:hypothetical protein Q2941_14505 [Bradyrhizobium sp. UFLA05-153]
MAVDYWWVGFFVDDATRQRLKPHFKAAAANSSLSIEAEQAIAAWRANPGDFEEAAFCSNPETAAQTNAFICAFGLPGFVELAVQLLIEGHELSGIANEQNLFGMVITSRHAPVSIVWHALGAERSELLPGRMGNMLLAPNEVEAALEATHRAYSGLATNEMLTRARRYCGHSVRDDELRETLDFLPGGLAEARGRNLGFATLACPRL